MNRCRSATRSSPRRTFEHHVVLTESSLGGAEVAIAFKPRASWDKAFQFFRLYR